MSYAAGVKGEPLMAGFMDTKLTVRDTRTMVHIVRAYGLPNNVTEKDVAAFFHDCNIVDNGIYLSMGKRNRPSGACFVKFAAQKDRAIAKLHNGQQMGKRIIGVGNATHPERMWFLNNSHREEEATSTTRCASRVVRISGLDDPITRVNIVNKEDLLEFFKGWSVSIDGAITVTTDQNGDPTGEAYVGLATDDDASKALKTLQAFNVLRRVGLKGKRLYISDSSPDEVKAWKIYYYPWKYMKVSRAAAKKPGTKGGKKK